MQENKRTRNRRKEAKMQEEWKNAYDEENIWCNFGFTRIFTSSLNDKSSWNINKNNKSNSEWVNLSSLPLFLSSFLPLRLSWGFFSRLSHLLHLFSSRALSHSSNYQSEECKSDHSWLVNKLQIVSLNISLSLPRTSLHVLCILKVHQEQLVTWVTCVCKFTGRERVRRGEEREEVKKKE